MKKIALITWYKSINYGTCLQAYALFHTLSRLGYDVEVPEHLRYKTLITVQDGMRRVVKRIRAKLHQFCRKSRSTCLPPEMAEQYRIRKEKMFQFAQSHLKLRTITDNSSFYKMNEDIDIFIVGSDQIWNPYYLSAACLLNFASDEKKKISYSTSIGVDHIPRDLQQVYRKYLSRFDALSVREESASHLLEELILKEVKVVVDPTFLLSQQDILKLVDEGCTQAKQIIGDDDIPYILCYFIGSDQNWVNSVKEMVELTGYKVIVVMTESKIIPTIGEAYASVGMEEFLWLLAHAEYVCTDSFHCTALSINLEKQFFTFKRFSDLEKGSQNSRIYDILKRFNLMQRLLKSDEHITWEMMGDIDYYDIHCQMEKLIMDSEQFLINALEK